jgi:hypothetical protein
MLICENNKFALKNLQPRKYNVLEHQTVYMLHIITPLKKKQRFSELHKVGAHRSRLVTTSWCRSGLAMLHESAPLNKIKIGRHYNERHFLFNYERRISAGILFPPDDRYSRSVCTLLPILRTALCCNAQNKAVSSL